MNKEFVKVEKILNEGIFVNFKKGLSILLFAVTTEAMAVPPHSNYNYSLGDSVLASQVSIPQTEIEVQLESNLGIGQNSEELYESLMLHRGQMLTPNEMRGFWSVAKQVSEMEFKDSMVCYDEEDHQINYDLLMHSGKIVHITQYFDEPTDQVVFSIENDGHFIYAGHLPFMNFSTQLLRIIREIDLDS